MAAVKKALANHAAARGVRATSSAPEVSLSSRWTSLGRTGASPCNAPSRPSTWLSVFVPPCVARPGGLSSTSRSEEHTSEPQSLMRISYAVFCLKKKKQKTKQRHINRKINDDHPNTMIQYEHY